MKLINTTIEDLYIIEPNVIKDQRGCFFESYNKDKLEDLLGYKINFVQDNQSVSSYGTVRGLHSQLGFFAQTKLVRCTSGSVLDVAVDLRPESRTFGKYFSVILSEENSFQLLIPGTFAHGFQVLSEKATVQYKVDEYWYKQYEISIKYDDPTIDIKWPKPITAVSEKDKNALCLNEYILKYKLDIK